MLTMLRFLHGESPMTDLCLVFTGPREGHLFPTVDGDALAQALVDPSRVSATRCLCSDGRQPDGQVGERQMWSAERLFVSRHPRSSHSANANDGTCLAHAWPHHQCARGRAV